MLTNPISQNYLELCPQVSTSPYETHAALVVSQGSFTDVSFSAGFETIQQLRTGSAPNAWESAWAIFDYTDNQHFYYVAFKPNGWELGKADPAYPGAQRFLATGSTPVSAIGTEHSFDIQQTGNVLKVWLDGALLTTFTDNENPYLSGKIGFYTEDAKVAFDNVTGSVTENFESYGTQTFGDGAWLGSSWYSPFVGFGIGAIVNDGSTTAAATPTTTTAQAPAPSNLFDLPLSGDPTNSITGGVRNDTLYGTTQNDLIDGRKGADRMDGGLGDDTYKVNTANDRVTEWAGEGVDTVLSTASSFTLGWSVENLFLKGATSQTAIGNALNNVLMSNDVAGNLQGGDGHDILVSGKGSDQLTGGAGADTFVFNSLTAADRHITDFQSGVDKIDIHQLFAAYTGTDPYADGRLFVQANAQGGADIVVDGDGSGQAAPVLVASIDGVAPSALDLPNDLFWY
ncbi:MAG TPA: family 16 glycoside hydrolase [Burkholderiales bacterium]